MRPELKNKIIKIAVRTLVIIMTVILLLAGTLYWVMWILVHGPSPIAKNYFVNSVKETSAAGFLANIYLSKEEIDIIINGNKSEISNETTDTSLIQIPHKDGEDSVIGSGGSITTPGKNENSSIGDNTPSDGIEVIDIKGSTYNGKMLLVKDPTRVFVGIPGEFGEGHSGLSVVNMIKKYDAVAGTNAGGFYDPNGTGTGGIPEGIVIYEGELKWGNRGSSYSIAGIDKNGILHVGNMTGQKALDIGVQYAASFGPALVINGKPAATSLGGGLNPRTAIGQKADGTMMLLVINGRSIDSLGATLDDLAAIMLSHGAVNATNLDGGSSSIMYYDGKPLTSSAYVFGERVVATAILVK